MAIRFIFFSLFLVLSITHIAHAQVSDDRRMDAYYATLDRIQSKVETMGTEQIKILVDNVLKKDLPIQESKLDDMFVTNGYRGDSGYVEVIGFGIYHFTLNDRRVCETDLEPTFSLQNGFGIVKLSGGKELSCIKDGVSADISDLRKIFKE